jgi:catechol 2,3-dioxygenase-like lactoylglutathione lyase family enzyme
MNVHFDHTIVPVRDNAASTAYLSELLGLPAAVPFGPFLAHTFANGVQVHYASTSTAPEPRHYAYRVGGRDFEEILARIRRRGLSYWADPFLEQPDAVYVERGDRGLYWHDPDGHVLELITAAPDGAR